MGYKALTETGKVFIRSVISKISAREGNQSMIKGKNRYNLPYSDVSDQSIEWVADIYTPVGDKISNNDDFASYIISLFNEYAEIYDLDANIIAAQAYQESRFKAWNYAESSTASGISQFTMLTIYDMLFERRFLSENDRTTLTVNMELPELKSSWIGVLKKGEYTPLDRQRQFRNRTILHQNVINNPDIMIKAQCALMSFIGDRNQNLASNALFAYNRGSGLRGNSYPEIINKTAKRFGNEYIKEGVGYVANIFGFLGDKNNEFITTQPRDTIGLWFGYKNIDFGFDVFNANVASSNADTKSSRDINDLQAELKTAYLNAKSTFETKYSGQYSIGVSSVHRSVAKQQELFLQGRNRRGEIVDRSKVVTFLDGKNKKSKHNYLKAKGLDFFVLNENTRQIEWNNIALFTEFANIVKAQSTKISWGGDWTGGFKDYPHLQII
jgi:hypothetical protein